MISLPERYATVVKDLGGGGMSDTLLCNDLHLNRHVVIKSLKLGMDKHRLLDELSALAAIRSKYVVQVFDVIHLGSEPVGFVEEFILGKNLEPLKKPIQEKDTIRAIFPIAAGVSDIHRHDRVHRDLKPDNMKFDSSGDLKIFDFGLAKIANDAKTKNLFFTPGYSAPEIFKPDSSGNHTFTKAVDVFAVGAIAFWLLNDGQLPSELSHMPPTIPSPAVDFKKLGAPLPHEIVDILNRCLSAAPEDRPSSIELTEALGRHLLKDQHRMLLTYSGKEFTLHSGNKIVELSDQGDGIKIEYTGFDFIVTAVSGSVLRNNSPIKIGERITGASVIVLGNSNGGKYRISITADVSHPEVLL